jgi:enoyl-CoA hydratase/carnithine racemase
MALSEEERGAPPLRVERPQDGVALVVLDRPERRNALSIALRLALADTLDALADDASVRAIVLTGEGSAFCAGMDIGEFGGDREHKERIVESSVRCFRSVARCPAPLLAAINGPAVAGGFALALLCDIRVAAPTATLGFPELGRHIPPPFAIVSAVLPAPLARELCLTGRLLGAPEANALGVVNELGRLDEALALAVEIADHPRAVTRTTKRRAIEQGETTWLAAMEAEERELRAALLG